MKCKGRLLAAILAVFMLLSMFPVSIMAADVTLSDIDVNTTTGKSVTELVRLGIINGYEDGTFRPDQTITRGEFAKIVITFLGLEKIAFDNVASGFADVDGVAGGASHWAKKFIKLAADRKIVNGYEDGTFRPDANVSFVEAVKMLVCALGYGQVALDRTLPGTPWYSGYRLQADELGILDKADVNNIEDPASRGIVAILSYNSLDVDTATVNSKGETIINQGSSALEQFQGKNKISGVVTAVQQTGLSNASSGLSKRQIVVTSGTTATTYEVPADFDAMRVLGRRISAYVEDGESEHDLISQIAVEKTRSTVITSAMQPSVRGNTITYYESASAKDSKTINLESDIKFIYNGKYDSSYTINDIQNIGSGSVELICNDGDETAEVGIIKEYKTYVISSVDRSLDAPKVYGKYNAGEITIPIESSNCFFSLKKEGSTDDAERIVQSLTEWNILSVARSKEGAGGYAVWEGIVSSKRLSSQKVNGKAGNKRTLGSKEYELSANYISYIENDIPVPTLEVGDTATVYLDHEGKIAAATINAADSTVYAAYMIGAIPKNNTAQVQLYGITGVQKERILNLAKTVRIDGTSYRDSKTALAKLKQSAELSKTNTASVLTTTTDYNQMIFYSLNANDEVEMIDTIATNAIASDGDLTRSYPEDELVELTYKNGKLMNGSSQAMTVSKATVLVVPQNVTKIEEYAIKSHSSVFVEDMPYKAEAYNMNTVMEAKFVLVYGEVDGATPISADSPMMVVKTLGQTVDINDPRLSYDMATGFDFRTGGDLTLQTEEINMITSHYMPGDIFRYSTSGGKIDGTKVLLKFGTTTPTIYDKNEEIVTTPITEEEAAEGVSEELSAEAYEAACKQNAAEIAQKRIFKLDNQSDSSTRAKVIFGTVLGREGNTIMLTPTIKTDAYGIQAEGETYDVSGAKIFLYDYKAGGDEVRVITSLDSIKSYNDLKKNSENPAEWNKATQVMMLQRGGESATTIIIFQY